MMARIIRNLSYEGNAMRKGTFRNVQVDYVTKPGKP
jgi:hypothetical protein